MTLPRYFARRGLFYGWVIVALSFFLIALIFGVRLSFGIFLDVLTRSELGWSRAATAGVFSVTMVVFTLLGLPAGWLLDRFGARRVYLFGLLVMVSGLVMTSRMGSLVQFYLFYGVWTGAGITILGLSIHAATLSRWFGRDGRRGLAIGLAFAGTGVGILVLGPTVERVIALYDWSTAFLVQALLLGGLGIPATWLFLRNRPQDVGRLPLGSPATEKTAAPQTHSGADRLWTLEMAVHTSTFWLLLLAGACSLFALRMITVHQVAHFVDNGISRLTAATVFGASGLVTAAVFIIFGQISDRIGRSNTFYIGSAAQLTAIGLLLSLRPGASPAILYTYALLWGIGEGSRSGLLTALASDLFPGPALGAIVGTMGAFFGLGAALGSWLGGAIYDWSGSYSTAFSLALVATLVATAAVWGAGRAAAHSQQ